MKDGVCRMCGCTDDNCSGCIAKTGHPCSWVKPDLCSACMPTNNDPLPYQEKAVMEIDVVRLTKSGLAVCNYANLSLSIQQFDKLQLYNEMDHFSDGVQTWHLRALSQEFPFLAQLDLSDDSDFDKDAEFEGEPFEIWFARQSLKIGKGGFIVRVAVPTNTEMWHHDAYFYGDTLGSALDKACFWQERGAPSPKFL